LSHCREILDGQLHTFRSWATVILAKTFVGLLIEAWSLEWDSKVIVARPKIMTLSAVRRKFQRTYMNLNS